MPSWSPSCPCRPCPCPSPLLQLAGKAPDLSRDSSGGQSAASHNPYCCYCCYSPCRGMREGFLKNEPLLLPTKKGIVPAASALLPLEGLSFLESYTACVPSSVRDLPLMQLLLQKKQVRTIGGAKDGLIKSLANQSLPDGYSRSQCGPLLPAPPSGQGAPRGHRPSAGPRCGSRRGRTPQGQAWSSSCAP